MDTVIGMDNPRDDATYEQYRSRGAFTITAVRADPDTKGMEADFAAMNTQLKTQRQSLQDLEESLDEHEALIELSDRTVDKLVRSFELRVLDLVGKNREDPRYRRYFGEGLRAITEADARTVEPKLVRDMIKTLDEDVSKADVGPLHAEYRDRMSQAVDGVEVADGNCSKVEEQIAFLKDKTIVETKLRWVEERKKLHAELTKKFPHDPARVESYFRSFAKPRRKKAAE